jgi:hypothetical protein
MPARVLQLTMIVTVVCGLVVAGTPTASAQALCPEAYAQTLDAGFLHAPKTTTLKADLGEFGDMLPGGTWRMPLSGGIAFDGLAVEGVSFTRITEPGSGSKVFTFEVVVDLRASDNLSSDFEFVAVDGDRRLRLGGLTDIRVQCQAMSVTRTFSIATSDFVSFFAAGQVPRLWVVRTTLVGGC